MPHKMIRLSFLLFSGLCVLAYLLIAAECRAQGTAPNGTQLSKIEVTGLKRYQDNQVINLSGLKIGQQVDVAAIDAATNRLANTGLFKNLTYTYRTNGNQMSVTFLVDEITEWTVPVIFDNFVWFSDEEIKTRVASDVPSFDGFAPGGGKVVDLITDSLESLLKEKNITGRVEYMPSGDLSGRGSKHLFSVKGVQMPLCLINFPGAQEIKETELVKNSKQLLSSGDYSRTFLVDYAETNLIPLYRERGFLQAKFQSPLVKSEPAKVDCKSGVSVNLPIEEGLSYHWDKAEWSGNSALNSEQLSAAMGMKQGEVANGLKIGEGVKAASDAYGTKGYITAKISPTPSYDDGNKKVAFRFDVNEGPQFKMGALVISGLAEKEISRLSGRWKLQAGAIYDSSYLRAYL